ncbi:TPA: hypothetical protein ACQ8W7_002791 [Escherichia coli]
MSRPDWGALQQEYIAEYTRSGISPVAWCEARGLNYATARRYIKKTPKNAQKEMRKTAQKSARKKTAQTAQRQNGKSQKKKAVSDALLIEGDTEEISFCPDEFGISDQQAKFAMLVAQGKKPTEAYRLAGYEGQGATANSNASRMLRNARVYRAISYFRNQYQKRYTADLDLLVSQLMAIVQADPNQLAQFRRVNCRYCWGENHLYQWRDIAEFDKAAAQASRDGKPEPEYGGLGFVDNAISTLDNRTTPQCRIRDRLKYTLDNKPVGHSVPYLHGPGKIHFCCRSTETFILKSAKELGIDVRDISPAERASMDGVVAGDTTYREWFLRQPYTRQKQIVGETRAKLIRDGGMSPDEFYTDKGEWLTLKQLRERDAQVFRKAGI